MQRYSKYKKYTHGPQVLFFLCDIKAGQVVTIPTAIGKGGGGNRNEIRGAASLVNFFFNLLNGFGNAVDGDVCIGISQRRGGVFHGAEVVQQGVAQNLSSMLGGLRIPAPKNLCGWGGLNGNCGFRAVAHHAWPRICVA